MTKKLRIAYALSATLVLNACGESITYECPPDSKPDAVDATRWCVYPDTSRTPAVRKYDPGMFPRIAG